MDLIIDVAFIGSLITKPKRYRKTYIGVDFLPNVGDQMEEAILGGRLFVVESKTFNYDSDYCLVELKDEVVPYDDTQIAQLTRAHGWK